LITVHLPYVFKIVFIAMGKQSASDTADVNRFFPVNQVFSTEFARRKNLRVGSMDKCRFIQVSVFSWVYEALAIAILRCGRFRLTAFSLLSSEGAAAR
jgi:hypothetical protein